MSRLGEHTWTELSGPAPRTVLLPVGALEQHGPHLPLDTDARIAAAVARRAAHGDPAVLLAPPLPYGASGEHEGFAGTLSIGHAALRAVLVELGRSAAHWASRLVFVNGHGGNLPTVPDAVAQLRREGRDVAWFGCAVPQSGTPRSGMPRSGTPRSGTPRSGTPRSGTHRGDAHAGRTETAILLALDPSVVRPGDWEPGNTASLAELLPTLVRGGVAAASPNGILGDPRGATAEEGEELLAGMAADLRYRLTRWQPDDRGRLS